MEERKTANQNRRGLAADDAVLASAAGPWLPGIVADRLGDIPGLDDDPIAADAAAERIAREEGIGILLLAAERAALEEGDADDERRAVLLERDERGALVGLVRLHLAHIARERRLVDSGARGERASLEDLDAERAMWRGLLSRLGGLDG
jgi:hypothetical protein